MDDGTAKPTFYLEIKLAPSVDDPRRLVFIAAPNAPKPPEDLVALRRDYDRTARVVGVFFADEQETRKELFLLLHQAADRGLRGPDFSIEDGRANLVSTQESITDYAHKIRDRRFQAYSFLLVVFGVLPLLLGVLIFVTNGFGWFDPPTVDKGYTPLFTWILAALWIPAGAAICVWGEFALRMQGGLSYD
jgi:hypothetical protein